MSLVYVMGDLHFSAIQEWSLDVGDKFLDWFKNQPFEQNSELIQLGDCVETSTNPGKVYDQLHRWINICSKKFLHTYVLQGNHDIKTYKTKAQSALEFIKDRKSVV
jgi:UDP-2,3-diacylglucosamine pyrophosphatase LpxH